MKYGILIGRFQPLHLGHQTIINEILADGLHPLIFIGSTNKKDDKNPLTYIQRASIINNVYASWVTTLPLPDMHTNEEWVMKILRTLADIGIFKKDCKIYLYEKPGDIWLAPWLANDFEIHTPKSDILNISATEIRNNFELAESKMSATAFYAYKNFMNRIEPKACL